CTYGISRETTQERFEKSLVKAYAASRVRSTRDAGPLSSMADLCRRWYSETGYVDKLGNPKALSWDGRKGTLLKLAERVNGKRNAKEVISNLISHKHIRRIRHGGWVPKAQVIAPSGLDAAQVLRAATMFERLLRTVAYNSERNYRGDVLLEVMAQVPRLPARDVRSFKKFAKAQGLIFAMSVDDWLESRNIPRNKQRRVPTRQAGVIAFAFEQSALRS
ncbi:MAG TPA: hypothetical protein VIV63_00735, partial [Steroidobacteraceae bacterium]